MSSILIKNCLVLPMTKREADKEKFFVGSIGIADGRIVFANSSFEDIRAFEAKHGDGLKTIDGAGCVAMPGLINLHNHVSMSLMRSLADDLPLMPWLHGKIWPFEAKLSGEDVYAGAKLGITEMLLGGTTSFADMYWMNDRVAQAADEMGIRALIGSSVLDGKFDVFEEDFLKLAEKYGTSSDSRISVAVAPHAPYTCSPETIGKVLGYCEKYGAMIHTHIAETTDEIEIIRERYGKSPVKYLEDLGVFEYPVLAAHCIYIDEEQTSIMKRYGVSIAHNPQSNMKLASGAAPVARMLDSGINVGLGTDGPSSNNDLDMWEEMRSAAFMQKLVTLDPCVLPAYQVLQMATVNGAKALGMEGELGIIKKGARADVILVDIENPHLYPHNDIIANLVYAGKASDVDTVIIDGKVLVKGRKLQNFDVSQICREAAQHVQAVKRR